MNEDLGLLLDYRRIRDGVVRISLFTHLDGLLIGLYRASGKTKSFKFRPLCTVRYLMNRKQELDLNWFNDLSVVNPLFNVHSDLVKQCIILYFQELLVKSIMPNNPNAALYRFLMDCVNLLDDSHRPANFPLWATIEIIRHHGFLPHTNEMDKYFSSSQKVFSCEAKDLIKEFLPLEWSEVAHYSVSSAIRREALEMLIYFLCEQLEIKSRFYSVEILHEVLHT